MQYGEFYITVLHVYTHLSSSLALVELMTTEIERLEHSTQKAKEHLDLGNALERLLNNRDFKAVIQHGYFEQEAIRLVHLKADPAMDRPDKQACILRDIDAIGTLAGYLNEIKRRADLAKREIEDNDLMLDELRNEAL